MYKYYSINRPVSIGTYPKNGFQGFENYNFRKWIGEINHDAWGELYYDRVLTEKEENDYELIASHNEMIL